MVIHTIPNLGMANTLINDKTFKEELLCRSYMYIHPMRGADAFPLLLAMHQSYPFTRSVLQASTITWSLLFHKCISAAAFPVFTLLKEILPNTTHPDEQSVPPNRNHSFTLFKNFRKWITEWGIQKEHNNYECLNQLNVVDHEEPVGEE